MKKAKDRRRRNLSIGLVALAAAIAFLGSAIPSADATTATLSGTVVDSTNQWGVPGVHVDVANPDGSVVGDATTDALGNFSIPGLTQEIYSIHTYHTGYVDKVSSADLSLGSTSASITIDPFASISGTLDVAVANVQVTAQSTTGQVLTVTTDAQGDYMFTGVSAGTFEIIAHGFGSGYVTASSPGNVVLEGAAFVASQMNVGLLGSEGSITGTVKFDYTYGTGTPTGNANEPAGSVTIYAKKNDVVYGWATTDANGSYTISPLPPGTYEVGSDQVYWTADDDTTDLESPALELTLGWTSGVVVTASQQTTSNRTMTRNGTFLLLVEDSSGNPLEDVTFVLKDSSQNVVDSDFQYSDSHYWQMVPLAPATYTVHVSKSGFDTEQVSITVSGAKIWAEKVQLDEEE